VVGESVLAKTKARAGKSNDGFHVGDRVRFPFGSHEVTGEVVEDLGGIGHGGRRLLRVRVDLGGEDPDEFEMPAEELQAA